MTTAAPEPSRARTISAWGATLNANITRLRVLVVGGGSVGVDVIQHLAAAGIAAIGIMDFDRVHAIN